MEMKPGVFRLETFQGILNLCSLNLKQDARLTARKCSLKTIERRQILRLELTK